MKRYFIGFVVSILFSLSTNAQICLVGDSWTGWNVKSTKMVGGLGKYFDKCYGRLGASLNELKKRQLMMALLESKCDTIVFEGGLNSYAVSEDMLGKMYKEIGIKCNEYGKVCYIVTFPSNLREGKINESVVRKINNAIRHGNVEGCYHIIECEPAKYPAKYLSGSHLTGIGYQHFAENILKKIRKR